MKKLVAALLILLALAVSGAGLTLTEVGFRLDLGLNPFRVDGGVKWEITIGAYGRLTIDDQWSSRLAVGSRIDGFYPFFDIGLDRTIIPNLYAEGVLEMRFLPGRGLTTSALLGARYLPDVEADARLEIATLPFSWILTGDAGALHGRFFLHPSLTLDGTLISPEGGLIGQGITLFIVPVSPGGGEPLLTIGGYAVSGSLATQIGFAP